MLLVVHLDGDLSFDYHILEICQKASCKVFVLVRAKSSISLSKKTYPFEWMRFSSQNLTIVHLFGCAIVVRVTLKSIDFMKGF